MNSKQLMEMGFATRYAAYAHEAMARAFGHIRDDEQRDFYLNLAKDAHKVADEYLEMAKLIG